MAKLVSTVSSKPVNSLSVLFRLRRFLLIRFAANFVKPLLQRSLGEKVRRQIRIVRARIVERLEDSPPVPRPCYLQRSLHAIKRMIVRIGRDFFGPLAARRI